ncbi:MAG: hypothetical protein EXS33_05945 [Pedosphaera sp.]|nr:hypothetical protein [Pedosphaera sp.]
MTSIPDGYLTLATGTAYGVTVHVSDAIVEPALALPAAILPLMNLVNGTGWTNLAYPTSPHNNSTTGGQGFFRLKNFTGLAHRPLSGEMKEPKSRRAGSALPATHQLKGGTRNASASSQSLSPFLTFSPTTGLAPRPQGFRGFSSTRRDRASPCTAGR